MSSKINAIPVDEAPAVKVYLLQVDTTIKDIGEIIPLDIQYAYGREVSGENVLGTTLWSLNHSIEWNVDNNRHWLTRAARYLLYSLCCSPCNRLVF